jgi:uncharacterized membrane protein
MIIAPLMTPIMATAAALVTGRLGRAGRSLLLVAVGVISVIGLSWAFGLVYTSREDVSDSLPGVAISISLVPPLCVVGLSLQAGEWRAAEVAFLLFVTNFLSILLAGGGVLVLLGLSRAAMVEVKGSARRNASIVIILSVLVVMAPLSITGSRMGEDARTEGIAKNVAIHWTRGTDYEVRRVEATQDDIAIWITGNGTQTPFADLVAGLETALRHPVAVVLRVVPAEKIVSQALEQ